MFFYTYFFFAMLFLRPGESFDPSYNATNFIEERKQLLIADRFGSLFTELAAKEGFNGNVLLSHNGKVLYKNAFGYADLKRRSPLNIQSVFQLASVSKQFTSVAIMILHDHGKLDFGDPLQKYFPDLPYKDVTIRQLLHHRSGIPDYMNFAGRYWKKKNGLLSNADLLDMLERFHPKAEFKPDQRYRYSNTNYAILASLIEKLSGQPYGEFMKENVFKPLGMHSTFVFDPNNRLPIPFETIGHNKDCAPAHEDYLSGVVGDKGIYTTVDDMFAWDQGLYTESLVKQSTLDEAYTPLRNDDAYETYGYGWRIIMPDNGKKILYHAGWWRGYNSLDVRRPEDKTFIVVLSNKVNWCFRNIDHLLETIDSKGFEPVAMRSY
jgi:CubicO group peptidase (beta-lactamase class C family)